MCSSGRWKRGCVASATKSLLSNHALKPLVPTLCLVVVVIYSLADKLRNFVAGIFIPQYHFPYAVALCFAQVSALCCCCLADHTFKYGGHLCLHFLTIKKPAHLLFSLHRVLCVLTAGYLLILQLHMPLYLPTHRHKLLIDNSLCI